MWTFPSTVVQLLSWNKIRGIYCARRATVSTKPRFLTLFWHFFDTLTKEPNIKVGVAQTLWLICGATSSLDVPLFIKGDELLKVSKRYQRSWFSGNGRTRSAVICLHFYFNALLSVDSRSTPFHTFFFLRGDHFRFGDHFGSSFRIYIPSTIQRLGSRPFLTFWRGDHFSSGIIQKKIQSTIQNLDFTPFVTFWWGDHFRFGDHSPANLGILCLPGSFTARNHLPVGIIYRFYRFSTDFQGGGNHSVIFCKTEKVRRGAAGTTIREGEGIGVQDIGSWKRKVPPPPPPPPSHLLVPCRASYTGNPDVSEWF